MRLIERPKIKYTMQKHKKMRKVQRWAL